MIDEIIKKRMSVYPKSYNEAEISKETLMDLLSLADAAPTHKKTEPWRFRIFHSEESRQKLSDHLGADYEEQNKAGGFSAFKFKKVKAKPMQSAVVLAIVMQRDEAERVPEWEEVASVAMAVQNIWLGCAARNIGSYWSSPSSITKRSNAFLELKPGERCLGLFYMGYVDAFEVKDKEREDINNKIYWI
jgi:nitroreductase